MELRIRYVNFIVTFFTILYDKVTELQQETTLHHFLQGFCDCMRLTRQNWGQLFR